MFREIREVRRSEKLKKKEEVKGYLEIKPSKKFNMSLEEIEAFWLEEARKAGENAGV